MKGKIALVLGVGIGYVLGSRAGRERYEQIKAGATKVWETDAVQRGVGAVRGAVDERIDDVKDFARRTGTDVFNNFVNRNANAKPSTESAEQK